MIGSCRSYIILGYVKLFFIYVVSPPTSKAFTPQPRASGRSDAARFG